MCMYNLESDVNMLVYLRSIPNYFSSSSTPPHFCGCTSRSGHSGQLLQIYMYIYKGMPGHRNWQMKGTAWNLDVRLD